MIDDSERTAEIEQLFCHGHPLDSVIAAGDVPNVDDGWSPEQVMAVLAARGWDLDGSGRLPRSKRTTVPRGLRGLPPAPAKTTSTTSRHRTATPAELNTDHAFGTARGVAVPDRLTGAALPTEPPTPAEALAEQSALDVPVGDPPERWLPPIDDPRLPAMTASVTVEPLELARQIRDQVDQLAPRAKPDGSVNASHVAMEQTLRERAGLPSYFPDLDGPGKFLPDPPLADWEQALVADPFDPEHPALQVPPGFVPGGTDDDDPVSAPPPSPDPVQAPETPPPPPPLVVERTVGLVDVSWPERPARMPCVVRPIMEPRTPIDPAQPRRRPALDALSAATEERRHARLADRGRRPDGRDLDDWIDDASWSPSPAVRAAADRVAEITQRLHDALDDLVRAEHAHQRGEL